MIKLYSLHNFYVKNNLIDVIERLVRSVPLSHLEKERQELWEIGTKEESVIDYPLMIQSPEPLQPILLLLKALFNLALVVT